MIGPRDGVVKSPLPERPATPPEDPRLAAFRHYLESIDRRDGVIPTQRRLRTLGFSVCIIDSKAMGDGPVPVTDDPLRGRRAVEAISRLLDETRGPNSWEVEYRDEQRASIARVRIRRADGTWVHREAASVKPIAGCDPYETALIRVAVLMLRLKVPGLDPGEVGGDA